MLKASKADKEALEDGDINSILFASAGSGGGGSGGGAGPSKSSSSGVDLGGNCEVTFSQKQDLKVYRNWMLKRQLQCGRSLILFQILKLK